MNNREKIGIQIQDIRVQKGLSVYDLAGLAGVTYQNIIKIENGRYNVSIDILSKVTDALGVEIKIG